MSDYVRPKPWLLIIILAALGILAIVSLGAQRLGLSPLLIKAVQVPGLIGIGLYVARRAQRALRDMDMQDRQPNEYRKAIRFLNFSALFLSALALVLGLATLLQDVSNALVGWLAILAYGLGAVGLGFGIMAISSILWPRQKKS